MQEKNMKNKVSKKISAAKKQGAVAKRKRAWKEEKNNGPINRGKINQ
jgi:hypothetical protein